MNKTRLNMLVEIAVFAAIGFVLDQFSFSLWPQGGSISFVMLPILLMACRWGLAGGITTGLLIGLLQMIINPYIVHWLQALLDYIFAFSLVGFAAVVRKPLLHAAEQINKKKISLYVVIGIIVGGMLRFICHTLSGAVFFGEYAPEGQNVWAYTIIYNGSYMIPAIILTAIVGALLFSSAPKLLKRN